MEGLAGQDTDLLYFSGFTCYRSESIREKTRMLFKIITLFFQKDGNSFYKPLPSFFETIAIFLKR